VKKSLKQRWDFSDKKKLQLWSDFLQIQANQSLKQRLVFSEQKGLQLWSDFLHITRSTSLKQRLDFSGEKRIATMVRFPSMLGFLK